uniref:Pentatricopeptide repeat-containing protein At5g66520-like n=1 Tax=Nelumbo nucifera TaxID=4432 RepID=A0A822XR41_NELNU|nr:TPA_asm: hypothetical protein HUJ06_023084 [Nelumbo nucifera]
MLVHPIPMARLMLTPTNQFPLETKVQTLSVLERCSDMEEIKQIHAQLFKTGLVLDSTPVTKLLTFSATSVSGNLAYAQLVFDSIQQPNIFMWNIMIRGYSNSKEPERALLLYHQMLRDSALPNHYTFPFLLKACATLSALEETRQIHGQVLKTGFAIDIYAANSLIHAYAKSGSLTSAHRLFDRVQERDIVSWNSMIDGYAKCGEREKAHELFTKMPRKNIISWTSMITACVRDGFFKEALSFFYDLQNEGIKPDGVALVSTLSACAHLGALDQGRWIHAYIDKIGIQIDPILGCALVDMYSKCGDVEEALQVFKNTKEMGVPVWTAMIAGFAIHGRGREALDLFDNMQKAGIKPNAITFTGVLTACSHAGLVDEGKFLFQSMWKVYNETPSIEHYGCMVNLLGRAGQLKEAKKLIETMPMKPTAAIWGALLNACNIHGDFNLGKQLGEILIEMDPSHGGRYIHLANIFAAEGQWDQSVKVRKLMTDRGVSKLPGCSLISLNGVVHEFLAGDHSHPQIEKIYLMWDQIAEKLRQEGYVAATGNILLDLEEKETVIHQHSEKLAIAFGFINTRKLQFIQC